MEGMSATHTPGPWKLVVGKTWIEVGGSDDYFVATLGDSDGERAELNRANGRLIAAAPDLLDAALLALGNSLDVGYVTGPTLDKLRAAIAKVENW